MSIEKQPTSAPIRIALIEDDPRIIECTEALLRFDGYQAIEAHRTFESALTFLRETAKPENRVDLVLLDGHLPSTDGAVTFVASTLFDAIRRADRVRGDHKSTRILGFSFDSLREDHGLPVNSDTFKSYPKVVEEIAKICL